MDEQVLDVRGRPCPQPVVETRRRLMTDHPAMLRVVLDDAASAENVTRMARSLGCDVRRDRDEAGEIHLLVSGVATPAPAPMPQAESCARASRNVVLISGARFGEGEAELGDILMRSFIKTLQEVMPRPEVICFINSAVFLTTDGSLLLDDLRRIEESGIRLLSCGTCLDYYHLKGKLAVGAVTNMYEVTTLLSEADRVIRP